MVSWLPTFLIVLFLTSSVWASGPKYSYISWACQEAMNGGSYFVRLEDRDRALKVLRSLVNHPRISHSVPFDVWHALMSILSFPGEVERLGVSSEVFRLLEEFEVEAPDPARHLGPGEMERANPDDPIWQNRLKIATQRALWPSMTQLLNRLAESRRLVIAGDDPTSR